MAIVISNKDGRLTIPIEARTALRIEGETPWTVEVVDGALVLRPATVVPREDSWAYTAEHVVMTRRAQEDARAGRVVATTGQEIERIAALSDEQMVEEIERLRRVAERGEPYA